MRFRSRQAKNRSGSGVLPVTVLDYWRWSGSDLMNNRVLSILGEFLVATVLDLEKQPRLEWNAYDLKTSSGLTIEIKTSAAKQAWPQTKPSPIRFDIAPHTAWDAETNEFHATVRRWAHVYVFCELRGDDPLDTVAWTFYVLSTAVLNQQCLTQKSIGLNPLLRLKPVVAGYPDLKGSITAVAEQ